LRSLLSRHQSVPTQYRFEAPAGSYMVVDVINPIKCDYRLIDLLKPETGAAIPVLLALEPGYRTILTKIVAVRLMAPQHRMASAALPSFAGDIRSEASSYTSDSFASDIGSSVGGISDEGGWSFDAAPDPLATILHETMKSGADLILNLAPAEPTFAGDISTHSTIDRARGLARMLVSSSREAVESRLPALLAAVRPLQSDNSFARDAECFAEYYDAARDLARGGFDYVLFGHTHLARDITLPDGGRYLNSGTWADLIKFPSEILRGSPDQAYDGLRA